MTKEWDRQIDRLRDENRSLKRELLQTAIERGKLKPNRGGVVLAVLVTSILWLTMFGAYWAVYLSPAQVAAAQPKPLTMVERAVCDRVKPALAATLVTTEWGAYWDWPAKKTKVVCVRR